MPIIKPWDIFMVNVLPKAQSECRQINVKLLRLVRAWYACVYLGLMALSTIFQSYHDGVWLR